jgi:hypothetical protein
MNQQLRFVIVLASGLCCSPAFAGDSWHRLIGGSVPDCVGKWCCDDYCGKREPCVCAPLSFCCDDYCPKKEPCVGAPLNFCCDDYRCKCLPRVCSPPLFEFLKCGPPKCSASCAPGGHLPRDRCVTEAATDAGRNAALASSGIAADPPNPKDHARDKASFPRRVSLRLPGSE